MQDIITLLSNAKTHGTLNEAQYHMIPALRSSVLVGGMTNMLLLAANIEADTYYRGNPIAYAQKEDERSQESKDNLAFGSFFHSFLMEPADKLDEAYFFPAEDKLPWNTTAGKAQRDRVQSAANGRPIIWPKWRSRAERMKDRATATSLWQAVIQPTADWIGECALTFTYKGKLAIKAKPDTWSVATDRVVNIKTTRNAAPRAFGKDIDGKYWFQAAIESMAVLAITGKLPEYQWFACEKTGGHCAQPYRFDPLQQMACIHKVCAMLDKLIRCIDTKVWPGYTEDGGTITHNMAPYVLDGTGSSEPMEDPEE